MISIFKNSYMTETNCKSRVPVTIAQISIYIDVVILFFMN